MRVAFLCFHLLLVLTLLANSVGSASAMVRMGMGAAEPEGSAAPATKHAVCHDQAAANPRPEQPIPAPPQDCCDGGACTCPCMGGLGSLIATLPAAHGQPGPALLHVDAAGSPHRSPALRHQLRPPIDPA
jgi:hypothetical protein